MSLSVPPVTKSVTSAYAGGRHRPTPQAPKTVSTISKKPTALEVKLDMDRQEVIFDAVGVCPVRRGDWVVMSSSKFDILIRIYNLNSIDNIMTHHRIEDTTLYPTVKLGNTIVVPYGNTDLLSITGTFPPATPAHTPPPNSLIHATLSVYDQNFDDMDDAEKCETIILLLSTLPRIFELQQYLQQQKLSSEPNLRAWNDRVSPAALGLLRWIIASNRSCIIQVDRCPGQEEDDGSLAKIRLDQKCSNVAEEWLQFRFAQGSPDKEQRFLAALKAEQAELDTKYPTLFAFHGSPLQNWHSIIRHGLDFKDTINGRAYGNGVYHAMEQNVSIGYSGVGTVSITLLDCCA